MGEFFKPTLDKKNEISRYLQYKQFYNDTGDYTLVIHLLEANIPDDIWDLTILNMKTFFKWISTMKLKYFFVLDLHRCVSIPATRIYSLQMFFKRKYKHSEQYLHCTTLVTSNSVVDMVLRAAFNFVSPIRPVSVFLTDYPSNGAHEPSTKCFHSIPVSTWDKMLCFMKNNCNKAVLAID